MAFVWQDDAKTARLVAALGNAHSWPVPREAEFRSLWPEGTKPDEENPKPEALATFAWTDANHDGRPQPGEVQFSKGRSQGVTVMNDLSFVVTRFGDFGDGCVRFAAAFDAAGSPRYDLAKPENLGPAGGHPPSSGGNQSLTDPGGWTIHANAPAPFSPYGLGGTFQGEARWSYPSPWPGLHASHEAAVPDRPGMVVGHTRLLITQVKGQTRALLYRAKVSGAAEPVAFSSPWRTIHMDAVEDVSRQVTLATDKSGTYEISIPLSALHWEPKSGETYRADVGVLRGSNGHTTQRVYWSNKATAITADAPSEAELTPKLWGKWKIVAE